MPHSVPRLFDRRLHRSRLDRAAAILGDADFLRRRASEDLVERLAGVNRSFPLAIEFGARSSALPNSLEKAGRPGQVGRLIRTDLSCAMLAGVEGARAAADEERLPFAEACADLIVSALSLHWVNDLVGALVQARQVLKPDGLFLAALLGGATLTELRQCLTEADLEQYGGAGPRVSPFIDAGDAGGLLGRAGFALPVIDVDRVKVRYEHPARLLADLRAMGETNALIERPRRPLTRGVLARAFDLYRDRFSGPDGRVEATFEIITLTGWAPHPNQPKPLPRGSADMGLGDALAQVRGRSGP